jgi:predicted kinase
VSECVIFVGLPASGKTTFYRLYFAATHAHVSKDLWPHVRDRDKRQRHTIDQALAAGRSVVVDNTNPTIKERAPLLAASRAHGARAVGYFFDIPIRAAVARNAQRSGRNRVPNVAIFATAKRLERPTLEEGFDQLFQIRLTPERNFTVEEVR